MSIIATRTAFDSIAVHSSLPKTANLGLAFDRLVKAFDEQGDRNQGKERYLELFSGFRAEESLKQSYGYAFQQWREAIKAQVERQNAVAFAIVSLTKAIFGSGNASALEVGLHLNKPWGVPYISGSSVKGLVASYLRGTRTLTSDSVEYVDIFGGNYGKNKYSGAVVFNDAWLYPDVWSDGYGWFDRDIINPHYQNYYSGKSFPDGTDDPIPVQTLALGAGHSFFVSLQGPSEMLDYLRRALHNALAEDGIGAKTSVGYGRFALVYRKDEKDLETERKKKAQQARQCQATITEVKPVRQVTSDTKVQTNDAATTLAQLWGKKR